MIDAGCVSQGGNAFDCLRIGREMDTKVPVSGFVGVPIVLNLIQL